VLSGTLRDKRLFHHYLLDVMFGAFSPPSYSD
jgi:hypothetical protein